MSNNEGRKNYRKRRGKQHYIWNITILYDFITD